MTFLQATLFYMTWPALILVSYWLIRYALNKFEAKWS
jgi:hypothetical protein